ncbi:hypothetical protein VOLCADRAFT_120549, partial [Volvox carteri f. nagariensis]
MASQVECIKWVPGTNFLVDGFAFKNPRCSHYFLTHFHSDHTVGLNKSFDGGVIYCSHVTARLLVHDMGIKPQVVKPLAVGVAVMVQGVRVTPLDANHCPGSVMFLFEVPATALTKSRSLAATAAATAFRGSASPVSSYQRALVLPCPSTRALSPGGAAVDQSAKQQGNEGSDVRVSGPSLDDVARNAAREGETWGWATVHEEVPGMAGGSQCGAAAATHNILHTGDCRWQRWMRDQPGLAGVRVDTLLLDTTYAAPKHTLPPQQEAIAMMVQVMRDALVAEPQTVFLVATYHIGKERAFLGAAQQLHARVWSSPAKRSLLRLLDLPAEHMALLVDDPREAMVHLTGWGLRPEDLRASCWLPRPGWGLKGAKRAYLERHLGVWKQAVGIRPTGTLRGSAVTLSGCSWHCLVCRLHGRCHVSHKEHSQMTGNGMYRLLPRDETARYLGLHYGTGQRFAACTNQLLAAWKRDTFCLIALCGDKKITVPKLNMSLYNVLVRTCNCWTFRRGGGVSIRREGNVVVAGVPYSEHSSWTDLCDAVSQLRPRILIPTVNASTPAQRRALVDRFAHLMDLSGDRSRLDVYLARGTREVDGKAAGGCGMGTGAPSQDQVERSGKAGRAAAAPDAGLAGVAPVAPINLGAVDVAEQERILADLQRRRELLHQRQWQQHFKVSQKQGHQQQRRRSKRSLCDPQDDLVSEMMTSAGKRVRANGLLQAVAEQQGGAGPPDPKLGARVEGKGGLEPSPAGAPQPAGCQATAAGAAIRDVSHSAASNGNGISSMPHRANQMWQYPESAVRCGAGKESRVCDMDIIDLSLEDEDEGGGKGPVSIKASGAARSGAPRGKQMGLGLALASSGMADNCSGCTWPDRGGR